MPNTGCGVGSPNGCFESCWCDALGQYECKTNCAMDAGPPYPYFDAEPPPLPLPDYDAWAPPYYGDGGAWETSDDAE